MRRKRLNIFAIFCLAIMMITSLLPVTVFAEQVVYATSLDGSTNYYSIGDAWTAAKKDTIVMQYDWNLKDRLVLNSNDVISIYMNGHTITRGLTSSKYDGEVIYMNEGSSLTLKGCDASEENITDKKFNVEGKDLSGKASDSLIGGGLVTGGYSSNGGGGVHMKKNAKLTLDNVIVGGNKANSDYGGGVNMNNIGSSLTLKNGAKIAYNVAKLGGGIYVASSNCSINLSGGSTIEHNYAIESGGGIYSYSNHTSVRLSDSSSISYNIAKEDGGGYYGFYSFNTIESPDKTGLMNYNVANDAGGAIYLESVMIGQNENSIYGICFEGNTSNSCGGAIYLNQEWTTVRDCVIKNNKANGSYRGMGGGVYNINDHNTFANCTITGNYAANSGGGIYQGLYNNILLKDKVIIKNNTRVEGALDDLYLSNELISTAYIASNPAVGSEVGIKIYADGSDRKIGENAEFDESVFFSDDQGFYIRYDSAEKEMYLAYATQDNTSYSVTVNDKLQGYYNANAKLTIDGTPSDNRQVFKKWNGDVDALDSETNVVASVSMAAKKDLSFTSESATKISYFTLTVEKPVAGKLLQEEGTLSWIGDNKVNKSLIVDIYWLVQNDDGNTQTASGIADYDTNYSVSAKIDKDISKDIVFVESGLTGSVKYEGVDKEQIIKAYVANDSLYIYGDQIKTDKADIESVLSVNISVTKDSSVDDLIELLPTTAKVYDTKLNEYTINLDTTNADLSEVVIDDKINNNGGVVTIPLKLDGTEKVKNDNNLMLTVNVEVKAEGKLKAPSANYDSGTYNDKDADGKVTLNIKLAADEGAKIYYKINDAENYSDYNSNEGINISAEEGQKKIFTITTYADGKDGYDASSTITYTYVLDNVPVVTKYTVTIKKLSEGVDIGVAYVAEYDAGESVTIGAPVISGYKFDSWTNEEGITIAENDRTSSILSVNSIENNIVLTANYSKVEEPTYDYVIEYVVQDLESPIELYRIESLAKDGMDVTPLYIPSTITDSDGNIYKYVSTDKCIVSKDSDNIFYVYYIKKSVEPAKTPTSEDSSVKSYDLKDTNQDGIIDCKEEMSSNNWIWSNTKKACVYKVNNTGTK